MDIDGIRFCTELDSNTITIHDIEATDENEAVSKARPLADRFLDSVCALHGFAAEVCAGSSQVEWTDPATGRTTKSLSALGSAAPSGLARLQKLDSVGNIIFDSDKPGHVPYQHIEAMTYFRRAELSTDIFDRYRNYHLAAENAASVIAQRRNIGTDKDEKLFLWGLEHVFGTQSPELTRMLAPIMNQSPQSTSEVGKFLYRHYRCALNHSKSGRDKKMPYDLADQSNVQRVLPAIEMIARRLIEKAA